MEAPLTHHFFGLREQQVGDVSCESELEELMQQIDIMVNSKKGEWEREVQTLEQRLAARDRELATARVSMNHKDCEIEILSKKLEQAEHSREEIVRSYEDQLDVLKSQLSGLKRSYEKLQFYHARSPEDEKVRVTPEQERHQSELQCLSQKLEEFQGQAREWEKQRFLYQKSLRTLSEQRKALSEKCDFFQRQSQIYQEQLSNQHERIRSDGLSIGNLRSAVKEIASSRDSAKEENQQLLQELRTCQMRCQRLETELSEATIELQARDDLLRAVELDQRQMHKDIDWYKETQRNTLSSEESNTIWRRMNKEQVQMGVKLSHIEQEEVEKDSPSKEPGNGGLDSVRADIYDLTNKLKQQDVTVATLTEKLSELERGLHVREPENGHTQESLSAKEPRVPGMCPPSSPGEEEPVKGVTKACAMAEEKPAEEMKAAPPPPPSHVCRTHYCRSCNGEMVKPLNGCTGRNLAALNMFDPCDGGWGTPSQSLLIDQSCLEAIFPLITSDDCPPSHGLQHPDMDEPLVFLSEQRNEPLDQEESFVSAAERFLQEENRRAEDFEKILNSHIEELQRQSEHTVSRCTTFARASIGHYGQSSLQKNIC